MTIEQKQDLILKKTLKQELLKKPYAPHQDFKHSPLYIPGAELNSGECTRIIFGEGNPNATILFIGEAPGKAEDLEGRPFVGPSGKLLNQALEYAGLKRQDVFITNIVKCRPPNNRTPLQHELKTGRDLMLLEQIRIINPVVICTLGSAALNGLTENGYKITAVHGQPIAFGNHILLPTYHPAYILRNRKQAQLFFDDIKMVSKLASTNVSNR